MAEGTTKVITGEVRLSYVHLNVKNSSFERNDPTYKT
jgi:hypothetical protein